MKIKYVHTNLVSKDWEKLAKFYVDVFSCKYKYPERDLNGKWLDNLTAITNSHIHGIHLILPGYEGDGPTLEIFQYDNNVKNENKHINTEGFGHIAFLVDDVEKCFNELIKYGGSKVGEIVKSNIENVGNIHVVYAKDPEGNIIEIQKWE